MKVTIEIDGKVKTFDLPEAAMEALEQIAHRNGLSIEAALEQALVNENFIEGKLDAGDKLLYGHGDNFRELQLA